MALTGSATGQEEQIWWGTCLWLVIEALIHTMISAAVREGVKREGGGGQVKEGAWRRMAVSAPFSENGRDG